MQALKDFEMQHMAAQLQLGLGCYSFEGGEPEEVLSLTTSTLQVQFRVPRSLGISSACRLAMRPGIPCTAAWSTVCMPELGTKPSLRWAGYKYTVLHPQLDWTPLLARMSADAAGRHPGGSSAPGALSHARQHPAKQEVASALGASCLIQTATVPCSNVSSCSSCSLIRSSSAGDRRPQS